MLPFAEFELKSESVDATTCKFPNSSPKCTSPIEILAVHLIKSDNENDADNEEDKDDHTNTPYYEKSQTINYKQSPLEEFNATLEQTKFEFKNCQIDYDSDSSSSSDSDDENGESELFEIRKWRLQSVKTPKVANPNAVKRRRSSKRPKVSDTTNIIQRYRTAQGRGSRKSVRICTKYNIHGLVQSESSPCNMECIFAKLMNGFCRS